MATIITLTAFGRALSDAEVTACTAEIDNCVTAGTTTGDHASAAGVGAPSIRIWTTTDAANAWVTWLNTNMSPAPESATVQTLS
jgi:hypothetical protein